MESPSQKQDHLNSDMCQHDVYASEKIPYIIVFGQILEQLKKFLKNPILIGIGSKLIHKNMYTHQEKL